MVEDFCVPYVAVNHLDCHSWPPVMVLIKLRIQTSPLCTLLSASNFFTPKNWGIGKIGRWSREFGLCRAIWVKLVSSIFRTKLMTFKAFYWLSTTLLVTANRRQEFYNHLTSVYLQTLHTHRQCRTASVHKSLLFPAREVKVLRTEIWKVTFVAECMKVWRLFGFERELCQGGGRALSHFV